MGKGREGGWEMVVLGETDSDVGEGETRLVIKKV